jgi:hypothetical protein
VRSRQRGDLQPNLFNSSRQIALDQLRVEPKDVISCATKRSIAAGISIHAPGVPSPIDLDDHAYRRHQEIDDEAPDGHLAANLES